MAQKAKSVFLTHTPVMEAALFFSQKYINLLPPKNITPSKHATTQTYKYKHIKDHPE